MIGSFSASDSDSEFLTAAYTSESGIWWLYSGSGFCPQKLPDSFYKIYNLILKIGLRDDLRIHFLNRLIYSLVMLHDICVEKKTPLLRSFFTLATLFELLRA